MTKPVKELVRVARLLLVQMSVRTPLSSLVKTLRKLEQAVVEVENE